MSGLRIGAYPSPEHIVRVADEEFDAFLARLPVAL
jgi:hypothetical protein